MKNKIIIIILLVLLFKITAKSQDYELRDTIHLNSSKHEKLFGQIDKFYVDSLKVYSVVNGNIKMTYKYDESGHRVLEQKEIWNNNEWIGKERYSCVYKKENKISDSSEVWNGKEWIGKERNTWVFNEYSKISNSLKEVWSNGEWVGKERQNWIYNELGNPSNSLREIYKNNFWNNFKRTIWEYDSLNRLIKISTEEFHKESPGMEWWYLEGQYWTYDESGNEIEYKKDHKYDGFFLNKINNNIHKYDSSCQLIYRSLESWEWYEPYDNHKRDYYQIIDSFDNKGNKMFSRKVKDIQNSNHEEQSWHELKWTYHENDTIASFIEFFKDWNYCYDYHEYKYDTNGYKISYLYPDGDETTYKWFWTYNPNGDTLSILQENWVGKDCRYSDRKLRTYYPSSKINTEFKEILQSDKWVKDEKIIWSYNSNDSIITKTIEKWKDSIWVMKRIYHWEYDSSGKNTIYTIEEIVPEFEEFTIIYKETKTYITNISGTYLTRLYSQQWWDEAHELFPKVENKWGYNDNGNLLKKEYQEYTLPDMVYHHEGGWFSGNVLNYSYDEYGNIIKHKYQIWTSSYDSDRHWRTEYSYNYQYDEFGNLMLISSDNGDTSWVEKKLGFKDKVGFEYSYDCYKIEVFYKKVTGVEDHVKSISADFLIYPNPVKDFCTIDYKSNSNQEIEIKIIDIEGKLLSASHSFVSEGENQLRVDTNDLPNGIFFVIISTKNEQRKGILIK